MEGFQADIARQIRWEEESEDGWLKRLKKDRIRRTGKILKKEEDKNEGKRSHRKQLETWFCLGLQTVHLPQAVCRVIIG